MADAIGNTGTVDAINAAFIKAQDASKAAGVGTKTDATTSQSTLSGDVNFFLTMLTTQLKHQDPSSPMDTNTFTQQIAQYSGVQQQVTTNANLEKLIAASQQSTASTAVGYIGKEIESAGNTGLIVGGQGAFSYILPVAADSAHITIKNAAGAIVFSGAATTQAGRNVVIWDGKNSATGAQEPDGTYTMAITANDAKNVAITPELRAVTIVTGVEMDAKGNTLLTSGTAGAGINFNDVLAVRQPTRAVLSTTVSNDTSSSGT